jgi:hypothetical protein
MEQAQARTSGQDVLQTVPKGRKQKTTLLEVNSRDRDIRKYPISNDFRWKLQTPLKDVLSVQVVGGSIPSRIFNVDAGWNAFTFREASKVYTVTLKPGTYTSAQFCSEVSAELNGLADISNSYIASTNPTTDQFVLTRTGSQSFSLLFATTSYSDLFEGDTLLKINSPRKMMGFAVADYVNTGDTITSPYASEVDFLQNRIFLYLNQSTAQDMGTISRSNGKLRPHAVIYMDMPGQSYKTFTRDLFMPTYTSQPAPIGKINTLDISLRDEYDRVINLNNRDWSVLLEIVYID